MSVDGSSQTEIPNLKIGSYRLLQSLGVGGMSSVFRAVHDETGLEVALKVLPRAIAKNPTTVQRFLREAKSAETLQYPGIVEIYDHGIDQGRHYLVLEYVAGGDLHDRIRERGPMGVAEALGVIRSVAESLRYAQTKGLIHRDIKPANILLTHDGKVKLADLGLALQAASEDERVTREGTTVGTVDFMAPEQARDSRGTSIRSDMYSLGCTLYFLLTSQPPYSGGDIADKLGRHCNAPIPDASEFRADLSDPILALLSKLMAKRPEQRYENYDALIAAIDLIPSGHASRSLGSTMIQSPSPLFALVDEDEDAAMKWREPRKPIANSKAASSPGSPVDSSLIPFDDLSLSEMAGLADSEDGGLLPISENSVAPSRPATPPRIISSPVDAFEPDSETVEGPPEKILPVLAPVVIEGQQGTDPARTFILTCVLIGFSIVLVIIGLDQLFRGGGSRNEDLIIDAIEGLSDEPDTTPNAFDHAIVRAPEVSKPATKPPLVASDPTGPKNPAVTAWTEPADSEIVPVEEIDFGATSEARLLPSWALDPRPLKPFPKRVDLQRVGDPSNPDAKTSLKIALEVLGAETIDIHDNGPFFENDLRFVGDRRWIRASEGFRPIIVIEPGRGELAVGQSAYLELGEKELVLEGLDLVVDITSFSRSIAALISLRGGSLTLRDCTLTLVNHSNQPFSVLKTEPSGNPSRFLLDRSIVRGSFHSIIDVGPGPVQAALTRSLVFNGTGGAILDSGQGAGPLDREIAIVRSILATANSTIVRSSTMASVKRRKKLVIRALGSTFAHFQTLHPVPFCMALSAAEPAEMLDWNGDANEFQGWASWFFTTVKASPVLESLQAARSVWASSERASHENRIPWPRPPSPDRVLPFQLRDFAPSRLATLERLPVPSTTLLEQTVETFGLPNEPTPRAASSSSAVPAGNLPVNATSLETSPIQPRAPNTTSTSGGQPDAPAVGAISGKVKPPPFRELILKTDDPGQDGDLGLFLAANIKPGDRFVRVRVQGFGDHPFTPYRAPDGLFLEILAEARPGGIVPSWTALTTASSNAAIEVQGGSLRLNGLKLSRDGSPMLRSLIRVEHGHLILERCRLTETSKASKPDGPLIDFAASGTKPLEPITGESPVPFESFIDRPVCRITDSILKAADCVLAAEVGRGLIALHQSVVISQETLFDLKFSKVAKRRVEADLILDHCTFSAEQGFVGLAAWPGSRPGPERPLLVSSFACVYLANFEKGSSKAAAVLRSDPLGIESGALFWQSHGDHFEVPNFTSLTSSRAADSQTVSKRLDVRWDWVGFWGQNHARNITGPRAGVIPTTLLFAKLKPGEVEPGDLFLNLNGKSAKDLGADLVNLGLTPSPAVGRRR